MGEGPQDERRNKEPVEANLVQTQLTVNAAVLPDSDPEQFVCQFTTGRTQFEAILSEQVAEAFAMDLLGQVKAVRAKRRAGLTVVEGIKTPK